MSGVCKHALRFLGQDGSGTHTSPHPPVTYTTSAFSWLALSLALCDTNARQATTQTLPLTGPSRVRGVSACGHMLRISPRCSSLSPTPSPALLRNALPRIALLSLLQGTPSRPLAKLTNGSAGVCRDLVLLQITSAAAMASVHSHRMCSLY